MYVSDSSRGNEFADDPKPYVHGEFTAIKDTVLEMSQGGFRDLFTMGEDRHLHRTVLAYVNQVFQQVNPNRLLGYCIIGNIHPPQITGINLITYYAATIYQEEIGLSGLTSRALAAANGTGMGNLHLKHGN